jgi:LDH2 family malate/lactate/ureidoglycolate dehydrogenase
VSVEPVRISYGSLRAFAAQVLCAVGVPSTHADDAAKVLAWANLHGIDTHGVRNLKRVYVDNIVKGKVKPQPDFCIEHETPVTARVDGDRGLGLVAGPWAVRLAMDKARVHGAGFVVVRNSNHYGAAGYHAMLAVAEEMIGISMTGYLFGEGATIGVTPALSKMPMLSTNPIAVACPAGVEPAFLLDIATSIVPMNRIQLYRETGRSIPEGWGLDENGEPTTDPAAVRRLLPLGGSREMGSHKGYGLGVMVEILCALLSGGWDESAEGKYSQQGDAHFFGALNIEAFRPLAAFKAGMDAMIQELHRAEPIAADTPVMTPGEPEHNTRRQREQQGIPLAPNVVEDLRTLAATYGVPLELA